MTTSRHATVYLATDGSYRVVPLDVTPAGVLISREVTAVLGEPTNEELGVRVLEALGRGARLVDHPRSPTEWSAARKAFVRAMGYRSHRHLMTANSAVEISQDGDEIRVVPTDNHGTRGGYLHRTDRARVVPPRARDVGQAVREAARPLT